MTAAAAAASSDEFIKDDETENNKAQQTYCKSQFMFCVTNDLFFTKIITKPSDKFQPDSK